jgi:type IV fimbrial biogenesis protein FimT
MRLQRGVSLIEIMIGLVIIAILLVAGVPSFSTFLQNSQIRNAAEAIQNGLTLARVEAVRRNTNVQFVLDPVTFSWTVQCETASASCPGTGFDPSNIQTRPAAEGSTNATVAVAPTSASTLSFNGLGKVTAATLTAGSTATFSITNPTGGACAVTGRMRCLNVVVTPGGQIRMCDPALASTDPQAC